MDEFVGKEISRIQALVGDKGQVIGAVSGGVDSTVAAKLMHEAIGDRFHAVLVNNGLLRLNEAETVRQTLTEHLRINLTVIDASEIFLTDLKGITEPEQKRKIIGRNFINTFQKKAKEIAAEAAGSSAAGDIEWLLQGTLYPDVIESISFRGPSQTIKTHHNVGGLPAAMHLKLIEPLRELFKDEVRILGTKLGIPDDLVWRHPFLFCRQSRRRTGSAPELGNRFSYLRYRSSMRSLQGCPLVTGSSYSKKKSRSGKANSRL